MPARRGAPVALHSGHGSAAAGEAHPHSDADSGVVTSLGRVHGFNGSGGIRGALDRAATLAAVRLQAEVLQQRRDSAQRHLTETLAQQRAWTQITSTRQHPEQPVSPTDTDAGNSSNVDWDRTYGDGGDSSGQLPQRDPHLSSLAKADDACRGSSGDSAFNHGGRTGDHSGKCGSGTGCGRGNGGCSVGWHGVVLSATEVADAAEERAAECRVRVEVARRVVTAQAQGLLAALQSLQAAGQRLGVAAEMLGGEPGAARLREAAGALLVRRARMITALTGALGLGFHTVTVVDVPAGGSLDVQLESRWFGHSLPAPPPPTTPSPPSHLQQQQQQHQTQRSTTRSAGQQHSSGRRQGGGATANGSSRPVSRDVATLSMGGLGLPPEVVRRGPDGLTAWDEEPGQRLKVAAVLALAAVMADAVAAYCGTPLRHPLLCAASSSAVLRHPPPAGTFIDNIWPPAPPPVAGNWNGSSSALKNAWSLWCTTDEQAFANAVLALNKDIEQLLHMHGISSVGPQQVLHNLHTLASAAASTIPSRRTQ